jgi:hypothetical protein
MRLIWPAIGATTAVILCLIGSAAVWRQTTFRGPYSLTVQLESANPGSDRNPLRVEETGLAPRFLGDDGLALDGQPEGERMVMVSATVTQSGRLADARVLDLPDDVPVIRNGSLAFDDGRDVLNKMRTLQLAPAQSRSGQPVAVRVVYLFAQTTAVKESTRAFDRMVPRTPPAEPTKEPVVPTGTRSALEGSSAAA